MICPVVNPQLRGNAKHYQDTGFLRHNSPRRMESKAFSSVLLEDFLEASPKHALVLTSQSQPISVDSLKVSYANPAFRDIIGDHFAWARPDGLDAVTSNNLAFLLHTNCIYPSVSHFVKWIDTVLQNPGIEGHRLQTSFQRNKAGNESPTGSHLNVVDIEWEAVVVQQRHIILAGKTTQQAPVTRTPRPSMVRLPSHSLTRIQQISETSSSPSSIESTRAIKASSPDTAARRSIGGQGISEQQSFTTSYFTEAFATNTPSSPKGLDPWRHDEKVTLGSSLWLIVDFKAYCWRWNNGSNAP